MSPEHRLLPLPRGWTSIRGLRLTAKGLRGAVLDEGRGQFKLFQGIHVVTGDVSEWTVGEIIAFLKSYDTPLGAEPRLARLTRSDLESLIACGALTWVEALQLLAQVPGWQP